MNKLQTIIFTSITGAVLLLAGFFLIKQHKQIELLKSSLAYNVQMNLDMYPLIQDMLGTSVTFADCIGDKTKNVNGCNYYYFSAMQDIVSNNKVIINKLYKTQ